jgi:hypothetical protein
MKITKKEHAYLRATLTKGAREKELSRIANEAYRRDKEAKSRKDTTAFVEKLPPMQKDIELDVWLDAMLKKE